MSATTVQVVRFDSKELVDAELHTDVGPGVLAITEAEWGPARRQAGRRLLQSGMAPGDIPKHFHWDWITKSQNLLLLAYRCFGIKCEGKMQGLLTRSRNGKPQDTTEEPVGVERGSGNVFADLGIANPELALAKAELVQCIRNLIAERKLTQTKAAKLLGLDQPKVSALVRGRVGRYTIDRLFRFLNALGQQVEITVRANASNAESCAVVAT
jgi:predicted XRE-type DNA-binding protein